MSILLKIYVGRYLYHYYGGTKYQTNMISCKHWSLTALTEKRTHDNKN